MYQHSSLSFTLNKSQGELLLSGSNEDVLTGQLAAACPAD